MPNVTVPAGEDPLIYVWTELAPPLTAAAGGYSSAVYEHSSLSLREFEAARITMARINQCAICIDWRTARDVPARAAAPDDVPESFYAAGRVDRRLDGPRPSGSGWPPSSPSATPTDHLGMDDAFWDRLHAPLQRRRTGRPGPVRGVVAGPRPVQPGLRHRRCLPGPGPGPALSRLPDRSDGEGRSPWCGAPAATESGDALRDRLIDETVPRLSSLRGPRAGHFNVHDGQAAPGPVAGPATGGRAAPCGRGVDLAGLLRATGRASTRPSADLGLLDRGLPGGRVPLRRLRHHPARAPPTWPDGERSPGVLTVALIHRPEGLDYREWITRWHGTQSPVSAELQPRTRYVRNEVVRPVTGGCTRGRRHRRGGLAVGRARGRPACCSSTPPPTRSWTPT